MAGRDPSQGPRLPRNPTEMVPVNHPGPAVFEMGRGRLLETRSNNPTQGPDPSLSIDEVDLTGVMRHVPPEGDVGSG